VSLITRHIAASCTVLLVGVSMAYSDPAAAATNMPPVVDEPPAVAETVDAAPDSAAAAPAETPADPLTSLRDPFWPVGFRPVPVSQKEVHEQVTRIRELTRWPKLILRGITRTGRGELIAIIEGIGLVESGDIISMRRDGLIYRWRINDVTAAGISRTRLDVREPMSAPQGPQ